MNAGTDLARLIEDEGVGRFCVGESVDPLRRFAEELAGASTECEAMAKRGNALAERMFSPATPVHQIIRSYDMLIRSPLEKARRKALSQR